MRYLTISTLAVALWCGGCSSSPAADDGGPSDTDTDTGAAFDPQCFGMDDFTLCEEITDPDLSYDICVNGWCCSPGHNCDTPGPHFPLADTGQRLCFDDDGVFGAPDGGVPDGGSACPSEGEGFFGQDAQYGWDTTHEAIARFTRDTVTSPGEPVVVDNATGLMWQGCAAGLSGDACAAGAPVEIEWREALAYCDALTWGGHDTWRLPDVHETYSIIDLASTDPAIDPSAFPGMQSYGLWTSTSFFSENRFASLYAGLQAGGIGHRYTDIEPTLGVLCVRRGPLGTRRLEPSIVSGDRVVTDTATGLEWQGCVAGLSGGECESGELESLTWRDALAFCEDLSWAGSDDWRLPSSKELLSIAGTSHYGGIMNEIAFPNMIETRFWSSTSDPADNTRAMQLQNYNFGMTGVPKADNRSILCVRE